MSVIDAAKRLGMRQPGGLRGLALRMGVDTNALYHKLDPSRPEKLTAEEAELMTALTHDPEIASAYAQACGHVVMRVEVVAEAGDDELFAQFTRLCKELGDVSAGLNAALADHTISRNEERDLDAQLEELLGAACELRRRLHARAAADAARRLSVVRGKSC